MPLVACPKCASNLRVPDGSAAAVRCPKCKTVFTPPKPQPAFEVVEELPPPPPPRPAAPRSAPQPPPAEPEQDFEVLDDEPEAPRKRRSRDDDDYDDRPRGRGRRRGRDDSDDDYDDRPRGRGRGRRRDWDDDYGMVDRGSPFRRGKLACLLLSISIWLYLGALGVTTLMLLIGWAGADLSPNLLVLPGVAGMANWVVALVGLGFAIAGPSRAKGMAIAATSVAGVHLVLLIVCFTNLQGGLGGVGGLGFGLGGAEWIAMVSTIPAVDALLPGLIYGSRGIGTEFIFAVLTGGLEIARIILVLLLIQALARAARDNYAAEKCTTGVMIVSIVCGAVALVTVLIVVIVIEGKMVGSMRTLFGLTLVGGYTAYTLMLIVPGMAAVETKDALDRR